MKLLQGKVIKVLAQIRPTLQLDGGNVESDELDPDKWSSSA